MRKHCEEAMRLLKASIEIHKAEKKGLIYQPRAAETAIELTRKAVAEIDKTIELQKELIAEQDS